MLYYANGGPGPASALLRVHADLGVKDLDWRKAKAERWSVQIGWFPYPLAQLEIRQLGEYFLIGEEDVPKVMEEMRAPPVKWWER